MFQDQNVLEESVKLPKSSAQRSKIYRDRRKMNQVHKVLEESDLRSQTSIHEPMESSNQIIVPYADYDKHDAAHAYFSKHFLQNPFGHPCMICDRLWYENDLKIIINDAENKLHNILVDKNIEKIFACSSCYSSVKNGKVPFFSKCNGFSYPPIPTHLPVLDLLSERFVSPRIYFAQIRRLRHFGQFGIFGQIINVPINIDTMVSSLPRNVDDDFCINVHIKRKMIHKSSYLVGVIKKRIIKVWLNYLINTPLYRHYEITVNENFLESSDDLSVNVDEISEEFLKEDSIYAMQQTLLFDDEKYLSLAPGESNIPQSILFDEHAEELSFPSIYLGEFRNFPDNLKVSPFHIAMSELRRCDRRGVSSHHLLYLAMKIMRLRVRDSLTVTFRFVGKNTKITRRSIESDEYVNSCIERNLAFLKSIPNSAWYWSSKKKDLFAMIRQLGKPTLFFTMSADETGWDHLIQTLYKLKNQSTLPQEKLDTMHYVEKAILVNEDAVTCAINFNKLVNVLLNILKSKHSPFGKYKLRHFFKRIEFQQRGSPHAHILLWLENAPEEPLGKDMNDAISLIDFLISVSSANASGNINKQIHKHTFTCDRNGECRFDAPFMPSKSTVLLTPLDDKDSNYQNLLKKYKVAKTNLENNDYTDIQTFFNDNNISSDDEYIKILRAGINRPKFFLKRHPVEKWINPFNPFLFNKTNSNIDVQYIIEEYSVATYTTDYISKSDRGISNLQRAIIKIMDENPEFDLVDIAKKLGTDMLNGVEMSSQEAAWFLLKQPMCKSSVEIVFIPTMWPQDRQRIRKSKKKLEEMSMDSTDIWKENCFDYYEKRPTDLKNITLAQLVSQYSYSKKTKQYFKRNVSRIIRYRNYNMNDDPNEYKREMVTLHFPFDNEQDILQDSLYINIYDENEHIILDRRKEFESKLDLDKIIKLCREIAEKNECINDFHNDHENREGIDDFGEIYNSFPNEDADLSTKRLDPIMKRRENIMSHDEFCKLMRKANDEQKGLIFHVINHLLSAEKLPLQMFFTGAAGCGKTFTITLLKEVYNRFSPTDGIYDAFIAAASTGKAAVAINGNTIYSILKLTRLPMGKFLPLTPDVLANYHVCCKFLKSLLLEETSMISAELLEKIDSRLKQITGDYTQNFGGLDIILIGDIRQLPPVKGTPIYMPIKQKKMGPSLWRSLKFYELTTVMRQSDKLLSSTFTSIGEGEELNDEQLKLIESRIFSEEEVAELCPIGSRIMYQNNAVNKYNESVLKSLGNGSTFIARDIYVNCKTSEQETFMRQKVHKKKFTDTGGLPYEITFVHGQPYMITLNIDVADGLTNGACGTLERIETNENNEINRVWLDFGGRAGRLMQKKSSTYMRDHNIACNSVPIPLKTVSINLDLSKKITLRRSQFPMIPANACTIHRSQGKTCKFIVYHYDKKHTQALVYVALTRVTNKEGLFIIHNKDQDKKFYHGKKNPTCIPLQNELRRLKNHKLKTIDETFSELLQQKQGISIYSINCGSLNAHSCDLTDKVIQSCDILILSETRSNQNEDINIQNFVCIIKYRRDIPGRCGGVAIYNNTNNNYEYSLEDDVNTLQCNLLTSSILNVGEICATSCILPCGFKLILIAIYIYPNQSVNNIIEFMSYSLSKYKIGTELCCDRSPMILSGDFNKNFQNNGSTSLINYLKTTFELNLNNNPNISTTKYNTTIDAVFERFIPKLRSEIYVSYFSDHRPIISLQTSKTPSVGKTSNFTKDKQLKPSMKSNENSIIEISSNFQNRNQKALKIIGLPNIDMVSCYANSTITALFNCSHIRQHFKNLKSPNVLTQFYELYHSGHVIDIQLIRSIINPDIYSKSEQQDASAFLNDLLNEFPDIKNILQFEEKNVRKCSLCTKEREDWKRFNILTIRDCNYNINSFYDLQQLIDHQLNKFNCLEAKCSYCHQNGVFKESTTITINKDMIILQFNIFVPQHQKSHMLQKLNIKFDCSAGYLSVKLGDSLYVMSSAIHHFGDSVYSGHYTATINQNGNTWYVDDSNVIAIHPNSLEHCYMLILIKS